MTKLTKGQLIEQAREKIKALKMSVTQSAFKDIRSELELDLSLVEIALAALTAEPCGYVNQALHEGGWLVALSTDHEAHRDSATHIPLYRLPLLEGLK